jgi:hypothetical protein
MANMSFLQGQISNGTGPQITWIFLGKEFREMRQKRERVKKRPAKIAGPALEAVGDIVIWEGNYRSDIYNIVIFPPEMKFFLR